MSRKMSNAPVYYALAQAQFNPVAAMTKYVDEIQDVLRRNGYTNFEPQQVTHLQFPSGEQQALSEPQVMQTTTWLISKADRSCGFILNKNSISFHTTHYDTKDQFLPELIRGLRAVHGVVGLDHISRLGLRYLDAIIPMGDVSIDRYLADGLHGVEFGAMTKYKLNEAVFETESAPLLPKGTLVNRIHKMNAPLGYPPDLIPNGLVPMDRFLIKYPTTHAIIDTDHFVEGFMPLDFDKIKDQLLALHETIRKIFEATVTEYAISVWK